MYMGFSTTNQLPQIIIGKKPNCKVKHDFRASFFHNSVMLQLKIEK